jgi:cytochrome c oxidase assembly factor CtaG
MPEGVIVVVVLAAAGAYGLGVRRVWDAAGPGRVVRPGEVASFLTGMAVLLAADLGPIDARADGSLTAHMVQHLLLLTVAPPLIAIGGAGPVLPWVLPLAARRRVLPMWRRIITGHRDRHWMWWTVSALIVQTAAMLLWHAPGWFDAALRHPPLHALEHLSFLGTATFFWWAVAGAGKRSRYGTAVLAVFVACLPATGLGLMMSLADHSWYPGYSLSDQSMAGVLMWALGGLAYVIAAAALFRAWVAGMERLTPSGVPA